MAVNLNAISNATTTAQALSNLILVTPSNNQTIQPQNQPIYPNRPDDGKQPKTLVFTYRSEDSIVLDSDITDHYVESNTPIEDQIALRPEMITIGGFIGELTDVVPELLAPLKFVADKLTVVNAYVPALSETALIAYNEAKFAYDIAKATLNSAVSAWDTLTGQNEPQFDSNGVALQTQTKQQEVFAQYYGHWQNRKLFTVQTPWAIFNNMAIKTLRVIQDADTRVISDFEITFKKMRFAQVTVTGGLQLNFQGRAQFQAAGLLNNGVSTPPFTESMSSKLSSSYSLGGV